MNATDVVLRLRRAESELARERALRLKAQAEVGGLKSQNAKLRAMVVRQRAQKAEREARQGERAGGGCEHANTSHAARFR
jgi:hypothetical protein